MDPIGLVLRTSGARIYQNLAELVVVSLLAFAGCVLVLPSGAGVGGLFYAACSGRSGRELVRGFFAGARRFALRATAFLLAHLFLAALLFSAWRYHRAAAGFFSWTLLFFQAYWIFGLVFTQVYTLPLMVRDDMPLLAAAKRSLALALRRPRYTAAVWVQLLCAAAILLPTVVGLPLLGSTLAVFLGEATENALRSLGESAE